MTLPAEIHEVLLGWLDDMFLRTLNVKKLLTNIKNIFHYYLERDVKLLQKKCILYVKGARWCCRIFSKDVLMYDQRRVDGLLAMEPPLTDAELQQFLSALQ